MLLSFFTFKLDDFCFFNEQKYSFESGSTNKSQMLNKFLTRWESEGPKRGPENFRLPKLGFETLSQYKSRLESNGSDSATS